MWLGGGGVAEAGQRGAEGALWRLQSRGGEGEEVR